MTVFGKEAQPGSKLLKKNLCADAEGQPHAYPIRLLNNGNRAPRGNLAGHLCRPEHVFPDSDDDVSQKRGLSLGVYAVWRASRIRPGFSGPMANSQRAIETSPR